MRQQTQTNLMNDNLDIQEGVLRVLNTCNGNSLK